MYLYKTMDKFKDWLPSRKKKITFEIIIFFSFLLLGTFIYDDYGISWDEVSHRSNGFVSLNYIRNLLLLNEYPGFPELKDYFAQSYGVIFDLPMAYLEKLFHIEDSKSYFLMRHYANFIIFFISTICFYFLLKKRFSFQLSLLGLFFLILSPRIFAESFYNMKDLVFMSLFTIALFFSINFLNNISYKNSFFAALFCSMAISSRIMAIIIPFFIFTFFILESLDNKKYFLKYINKFFLFLVLVLTITFIFWPYLWTDPIVNFVNTFKSMSSYIWRGSILYQGNYISALNLPWHYSLVWIFITTPMLYIFLFVIGFLFMIIRLIKRFLEINSKNKSNNLWKGNYERTDLFIFLIFFFTLYIVIEINSSLYGGWRHLYFIYPCLIYISIIGLEFINKFIIKKYIFIFIIPFLIYISAWIFNNHPYQFVYFNSLSGKNINSNFEIDYWGLSNKDALFHIANITKKNNIKVYINSDSPYYFSLSLLNKENRDRIEFIDDINMADYLVTNHYYAWGNRSMPKDDPVLVNLKLKNEFVIIKEFTVDNIPINSIYKIN